MYYVELVSIISIFLRFAYKVTIFCLYVKGKVEKKMLAEEKIFK